MNVISPQDFYSSTDRYKIYLLKCTTESLGQAANYLSNQSIPVLNVGHELANFIERLTNRTYLNFEVYDYCIHIFEDRKVRLDNAINPILAIHNLGILMEPQLELNATQMLKEISKTTALIIIWENEMPANGLLTWKTKSKIHYFDFSDIPLKILNYEI